MIRGARLTVLPSPSFSLSRRKCVLYLPENSADTSARECHSQNQKKKKDTSNKSSRYESQAEKRDITTPVINDRSLWYKNARARAHVRDVIDAVLFRIKRNPDYYNSRLCFNKSTTMFHKNVKS